MSMFLRLGFRAGASSAAVVVARSSAACDQLNDTPEVNLVSIPDVAVTDVKLYALQHLNDLGFPSSKVAPPAHFVGGAVIKSSTGQVYSKIIKEHDCVLVDIVRAQNTSAETRAFHRAGPRGELHFEPSKVRAAIVTCGGLCPGLNDVIHHLVNTLHYNYGVREIYGIRGGYRGLSAAADHVGGGSWTAPLMGWTARLMGTAPPAHDQFAPIMLTPKVVKTIHHHGGTMLGSSRGGFDMERIIKFLRKSGVNQLYIIGGDGTHRGAYKLSKECAKRGMNVAVAGIPKTIDNDIGLIDRSFGFLSSVEAAQRALDSARVEATGNMPNGISLVKLMGRSSGCALPPSRLRRCRLARRHRAPDLSHAESPPPPPLPRCLSSSADSSPRTRRSQAATSTYASCPRCRSLRRGHSVSCRTSSACCKRGATP